MSIQGAATAAATTELDLLHGAAAIAAFLFGDDPGGRRKVYLLTADTPTRDFIPVFKMGGILCARKSTLLSWIAAREAREPLAARPQE
jgi:hypothetical protein